MTSIWILLLSKYEFPSPKRPSSTCTSASWSQFSDPSVFQWVPPPIQEQKRHCLLPVRCFSPGFCRFSRPLSPQLILGSAALVSLVTIVLHHRLKLSLSSNSCDKSKLHCLESVGSRKNEKGAKWWKQNISQGSYGYALPPGSSHWMGLSHSAAEGLSCWPPPLSFSEESPNLMPAITPLKVCLFPYKIHS